MVSRRNRFGALDIGSQSITFLLGERIGLQFNLIGHTQVPSAGVQKGRIEDAKALGAVLRDLFTDLSKRFGTLPQDLTLSQSGTHLQNTSFEMLLPFSDFRHRIEQSDLERLHRLVVEKELPPEIVSLHVSPKFYTVNGTRIDQPIGKEANQITAHCDLLFGKAQPIRDQLYAVNQFGFSVRHLVFSAMASALAVTMPVERENGVCAIDIGAQTTDYVVYKRHTVVASGTFPVGGQNFTRDVCSGLRILNQDAERLKCEYGIPNLNPETPEEIWVLGDRSIGDKAIKIKNLHTILQARAQELFGYVSKCIGGEKELLAGVVLTGGGALLKNIEKVAAETFCCDCCVRGSVAPVNEALKSPTYATCLGLLQYTLKPDPTAPKPTATSVWKRMCDWFKG